MLGGFFPVVPHAGTWIEIVDGEPVQATRMVVPHAGTWIEIMIITKGGITHEVVPHAGTWIEIILLYIQQRYRKSFPTRERGLKCTLHK